MRDYPQHNIKRTIMTTIQKINYLNEICNNTLSFTSFVNGWQAHSYGDNTPLNMSGKYPYLTSYYFDELVDAAYEYVINKQKETAVEDHNLYMGAIKE